MGEILKFPESHPNGVVDWHEEKAVTCGCGNQEFILVHGGRQVICPNCDCFLSLIRYEWVMV